MCSLLHSQDAPDGGLMDFLEVLPQLHVRTVWMSEFLDP